MQFQQATLPPLRAIALPALSPERSGNPYFRPEYECGASWNRRDKKIGNIGRCGPFREVYK